MHKKLSHKLGLIGLLSLLLLLPLSMIEEQVRWRSQLQANVVREIAQSAAGAQTLVGPLLVVRYRERIQRWQREGEGAQNVLRTEIVERTQTLPPQALDIGGEARVEARERGVYRARLYHLALQLGGHFVVPPRLGLARDVDLVDAQAFLVMGLSDLRGVANDPAVQVNGHSHRFAPGTLGVLGGQGLHLALGEFDPAGEQRFDFALPLTLTGSESLAIAPVGKANTIALTSAWPHPSFQGRFLPVQRQVGADGFEARWQVSHLARSFERIVQPQAPHSTDEVLAVDFIDPVNPYLKSERAVKYGLLFVVLTFAAFFVAEVLKRRPIHPLQYLLVGLALAIFFLLLLALAERIGFLAAYAVSGSACVGLIGVYLAGALGSRRQAAGFALGLATLYGVLYGVLLSEDNALLMGSLVLFAALGGTMLATRHIDWYRLGADEAGEPAP